MVDMAVAAVLYLLVGVVFTVWFLKDCFKAKARVDHGDGTSSDRRVIGLLRPRVLLGRCLFTLFQWPRAAALFIAAGPDNEEDDPQDRVPPQYR